MGLQVSGESTLTSKGQIVLAKGVREALGLKAGDRLVEVVSGRIIHLIPVPKNPVEAARRMRGMLDGRGLSSAEAEKWLDEGEL